MKRILYAFLLIMGLANTILAQCDPVSQSNPQGQTICYNTTATITLVAATGGDANNAYLWQQSSDGTNWSSAAGNNTGQNYTTPNLTTTMHYRRKVTNGCDASNVIYSNSATITVRSQFNAGTIQTTGQTVCWGDTPTTIGNVTSPTGGDVNFSYRWKNGSTIIPGAISSTYTPQTNTPGTYTREVKDGTCNDWTASSGSWTLTVRPAFNAGAIQTTGQTVCFNATATQIGSATDASGGNGNISYQWKRNEVVISGATLSTYTPLTNVSGVFTYKREAKDGTCNDWTASSGSWILTVRPAFNAGAIQTTGQTVCFNATATQIGSAIDASGGNGNISYQWKRNEEVISGATLSTYTPLTNVSGVFTYKREAKDGTCNDWTASSGSWTLTVRPAFNAGAIQTTGQTVCFNATATQIGSATDASGGNENISYQWKRNEVVISGATLSTYTPLTNVSGVFTYKREAKDGVCSNNWEASRGLWVLNVYGQLKIDSVSKNQVICKGIVPSSISVWASGGTALTYQWQQSTNGISNWTNINGATSNNYLPPSLTSTTYYRCTVTSGSGCGSEKSDPICITINETLEVLNISKDDTICYNTLPRTLFIEVTTSPGLTFQWQQSTDGISDWNNVSGGTGGTTANYQPSALTETTYYRCKVTSQCGDATSTAIQISVLPAINIINVSDHQEICYNMAPNPISVEVTGGQNLKYQWYRSDDATKWFIISGATEALYQPPILLKTTFYQCLINSDYCDSLKSSPINITVSALFTSGIIASGFDTICYNTPSITISSIQNASGGYGNITYQWRKDGEKIIEWDYTTYTPTESGIYTRWAKANACPSDFKQSEGSWNLLVYNPFTAGSIMKGEATICYGTSPEPIMGNVDASGGDGIVEYRWKCNNVVLANSNAPSYIPTEVDPGVYVYSREAKDATCEPWRSSEDTYTLTINGTPGKPEDIIGQTLLCQITDQNTTYKVPKLFDAEDYVWKLKPPSAGSILGSGDSIVISWDKSFIGYAELKVQGRNPCSSGPFGDSITITVQAAPITTFAQAPDPVCSNQQGLLYVVEPFLEDADYQWSVTRGEVTGNTIKNEITVKWDKVTVATTGSIVVNVVDNTSKCPYTAEKAISIAKDIAPDVNDIVTKNDKEGNPYMLIYPNPSGDFVYQWYKNNVTIDDATQQFYYPPNFGETLERGVPYKVYVSEANSASCGNFSKSLEIESYTSKNKPYFSVIPNPNHGTFFITFNQNLIENKQEEMLLKITSLTGEIILEQKVKGSDDIFINKTFLPGSYIVTFTTNDQQNFSQVIIVQ